MRDFSIFDNLFRDQKPIPPYELHAVIKMEEMKKDQLNPTNPVAQRRQKNIMTQAFADQPKGEIEIGRCMYVAKIISVARDS